MFSETIRNTPLSGGMADSVFPNITGEAYQGDTTMVATLRALLGQRIGDGSISFQIHQCNRNHDLKDDNTAQIVYDMTGDLYADTVKICSAYQYDDGKRKAELEFVTSHFTEAHPDFRQLEKIGEFYRRSFFVSCFINPETRTAVLIVDRLNTAKLHYLECSVLAFLPWYFSARDGVSDLEMRLIRSLGMKASREYLACIAEFAKQYDFRSMRIRALLPGFETRFDRAELQRVEQSIRALEEELNRLNQRFRDKIQERDDLNIRYLGLDQKIKTGATGDSEIMEYFLSNKHLDLLEASDSRMRFLVSGHLAFWDKDQARRYIANSHSLLYKGDGGDGDQNMKILMEAVFLDESVKIRFCGGWDFNLRGSADVLAEYDYGPDYDTYLPNPHLNRFGCIGTYRSIINECLQRNDYISAISQCLASVGSLNWSDSVVMREFVNNIKDRHAPACVELPDGKVVTPKEATEWIRAQKKSDE